MLLVGPDEQGTLAALHKQAQRLGLRLVEMSLDAALKGDDVCDVAYVRGAYGADKETLLSRADLFVLPTLSENYGNVVAEALASGMPVITTKRAPWQALTKAKAGWWIEVGREPLQSALQEAMALDDAARSQMGRAGRRLVQEIQAGLKHG